ncbi:tRNA uridine-5-carboxymethylaminomethyl(34) synthesis GTPase MnmE [Parasphingorhabdus halotolerans]|uniref:tRNA modification GTPase MnmE n=1 Tax=Parasphingorhabdus halotolerans TaxID=2725558 RepID=A0A6H2DLX1_9SPHN|nr:tRNA uridine-5-carboxymethylaminomethyl(34) synthesis GTPase MnmE [Parasphingorhabdus halotolerans]QJB69672.1 tRNA uridine-5-carboxymethylaminomethyl(34) synthesis GTPase MnmE [Parasphingorhabdus halotolerans]
MDSAAETIFALSSGQPPAAIGIIRISGDRAFDGLARLIGSLPEPRKPSLRRLTDPVTDEPLDQALVIAFPGPNSASGEDLAEIHCHGGRAVVRAIESALDDMDGLRRAEPGEFTRRAFTNGRMDLAEAEGLSDLLFAETEMQRRAAVKMAGGALSRQIEGWQSEVLRLSAMVEAELDFSDEDDVTEGHSDTIQLGAANVAAELATLLCRPRAEKLREGVRIVLGGPPNSGKSTLLNALVEREAAIVSEIAGTTRDVIEVPIAIGGIPFLFIDTAGVRDQGVEEIERIGINRARQQFDLADIILWLGPEGDGPAHRNVIEIGARSDHPDYQPKSDSIISVSPVTGEGMTTLVDMLVREAKDILPAGDEVSVNNRQAGHLMGAQSYLENIADHSDFLIIAEQLRLVRSALDAITGRASTEDMLDALFGKFCIGK